MGNTKEPQDFFLITIHFRLMFCSELIVQQGWLNEFSLIFKSTENNEVCCTKHDNSFLIHDQARLPKQASWLQPSDTPLIRNSA